MKEINYLLPDPVATPDFSAENSKRTYTVEEIQKILGISQPTAYALVHRDFFRSVRIGKHIRISKKSFDEWLDAQGSGGGTEHE